MTESLSTVYCTNFRKHKLSSSSWNLFLQTSGGILKSHSPTTRYSWQKGNTWQCNESWTCLSNTWNPPNLFTKVHVHLPFTAKVPTKTQAYDYSFVYGSRINTPSGVYAGWSSRWWQSSRLRLSENFLCKSFMKLKSFMKNLAKVKPGCGWLNFCDLDNLLKNNNALLHHQAIISHLKASPFCARVASSWRNMNCHFMHSLPSLQILRATEKKK